MALQSSIEEVTENFSLFDDWEERYRYLIDLGRELPAMDESLKTDKNFVQGCTSRVWMQADVKDDVFHFVADSDAHIVRGLIALLMIAYQDKNVGEIAGVDIEGMFKEIGLDQHLSPNRRSGFFAMVERIKKLAVNS
ncbi:MAG: cysteine desulfuration protein SufE [Micavibrio sp.]|nr:MAG: cysteine desulfuration protein SufE [Micavibrio sp.]